ncbi:MAG: zinc ribbon domain-containing protein [Candidatus Eisenbacteria bacterium]|uniref:Zinc ribbon domain-containing protein n=1 Tax=Eiseniibacteriota bacterium TaxID=2212470 RepID=A0A849SQM4_UNCEI|nr:zinc ribbon domain-containing protein [Candidatus Eisenbacteria bacterium]
MTTGFCPECGAGYPPEVVACPRCRAVLTTEPPSREAAPEVVHRVPDAAAGALLLGVLEHHGVEALLRTTTLPGYGSVRRDWGTSAWGEIIVAPDAAAEARALIAEYLAALERGGAVRDEDVGEPDTET